MTLEHAFVIGLAFTVIALIFALGGMSAHAEGWQRTAQREREWGEWQRDHYSTKAEYWRQRYEDCHDARWQEATNRIKAALDKEAPDT